MNIPNFQGETSAENYKQVHFNSKHLQPYRCRCGHLLFKSETRPEGLEIKCSRCKQLIEY